MTEPRLRELFVWIEAHRMSMIDHAGDLAELAAMARSVDMRCELSRLLDAISNKCQTLSMEIAGALSELERVHPRDPVLDDDTVPLGLPPPRTKGNRK